MAEYVGFEELYTIINISFVYLGLGECFQTRQKSQLFCKIQSIVFFYMTIISGYGAISGIYMFFFLIFTKKEQIYTVEDAAQVLPSCLLDLLMVWINIMIFIKMKLNKEIIREIKDIYPKHDEKDETVRAILIKYMKPLKRLIQFYSGLTNLQPFGFCLPPAIMTIILKNGHHLPFMMWYPYDFAASMTKYLITLYLQFVAAGYTAFSLAAVDSSMVIVMVNISMHLELLAHRLRSIAPDNESMDKEDMEKINRNLAKIVEDHVNIIK